LTCCCQTCFEFRRPRRKVLSIKIRVYSRDSWVKRAFSVVFAFPNRRTLFFVRRMTAVEDRRGSTRAAGIVGMAILSSRIFGWVGGRLFAVLFAPGKNRKGFWLGFG